MTLKSTTENIILRHLLLAVGETIPHPAAPAAPHEGDVVPVPNQEAEVGYLGFIMLNIDISPIIIMYPNPKPRADPDYLGKTEVRNGGFGLIDVSLFITWGL